MFLAEKARYLIRSSEFSIHIETALVYVPTVSSVVVQRLSLLEGEKWKNEQRSEPCIVPYEHSQKKKKKRKKFFFSLPVPHPSDLRMPHLLL
jgi:hypothetical protein